MKIRLLMLAMLAAATVSFAFKPDGKKPWVVPGKNAKTANPVKSDATSIHNGKELYSKHCQSCHGKKGLGDGTKSAELKTEPGDFTAPGFQSQSDGSIFYKVSEGRGDMPSFKKKIPDQDDIWSIVNYVRTLHK